MTVNLTLKIKRRNMCNSHMLHSARSQIHLHTCIFTWDIKCDVDIVILKIYTHTSYTDYSSYEHFQQQTRFSMYVSIGRTLHKVELDICRQDILLHVHVNSVLYIHVLCMYNIYNSLFYMALKCCGINLHSKTVIR